ncbi:hypothetical protein [Streptomyces sp. NBC_01431]|uniref:hypothetical protein n=1 Tax=Streptomyces sp. NBC_01431 TaxID=2903863 RepID=UPI002E336E8C|nr:hypothetical protein [Streptomyces sp. NBC_01431]
MRFEAGAEEEFEAACGLLVDRAALDYRHRATADGRLGLGEPRNVEELLLRWLPEIITDLPGEERGDAPDTLRTLLRYLHAAQLADPRGPAPRGSVDDLVMWTAERVASNLRDHASRALVMCFWSCSLTCPRC